LVMEFLPEPKCQLLGILDLKVIDIIPPVIYYFQGRITHAPCHLLVY
jgi:hypothetical protein